jgi:hypothetical protein
MAAGAALLAPQPVFSQGRPGSGRAHHLGDSAGDLAERLQRVVGGYSAWPTHRTGTPDYQRTLTFVEAQLRAAGARTERWSYRYPHYQWAVDVWSGRQRVPAVPLYYEGVGRVRTATPFVRPVVSGSAGVSAAHRDAVSEATAAGAELAVLPVSKSATAAYPGYDGLIAYNADPDSSTSGLPTVVVPGRYADAVADNVRVDFFAQVRERRASNVIGRLGNWRDGEAPVIITTPLTGWFTCAAERGTGLALALELARDFAHTHPVLFVGNTGHELDNYGVKRWLEQALDFTPRAVVHLGASLAAGTTNLAGEYGLVPKAAASQPAAAAIPGLTESLADALFAPTTNFPGEGAEWHDHLAPTVPLLSLAGTFTEFHTPDDVPSRTTRPNLLATVHEALNRSLRNLLDATA